MVTGLAEPAELTVRKMRSFAVRTLDRLLRRGSRIRRTRQVPQPSGQGVRGEAHLVLRLVLALVVPVPPLGRGEHGKRRPQEQKAQSHGEQQLDEAEPILAASAHGPTPAIVTGADSASWLSTVVTE